jgi:hypothetical protein
METGRANRHAPKVKGLADIEESHTARSLSVAGGTGGTEPYQERELDDWDNEDYADHMLGDGSQSE